jgi:hypothetical protein
VRSPTPLLAVVLGLSLGAATVARIPAAMRSGNDLNHVSGAWITLGDDLARGDPYRPLRGPDGFGGTRFFPLAIAAHGALVRLGADPVRAGMALSVAAGAALVLALGAIGRRAEHPRAAATALACLPLAGFAVQLGIASARGDLLAAALEAAGVAALGRGPSRRALAGAGLALGAALAAKPTAIAAIAAAVAWLLLRRERREALALGALSAAVGAALLGAAELASAGRFSSVVLACAGGGGTLRDALHAPARLAELLLHEDRGGLLLLAAAVLVAATGPRRPGLAELWLGGALLALLGVLASPGTGANHLAEAEAAAGAVLAVRAAGVGAAARLARGAAPAIAAAGVVLAIALGRADAAGSRLADARRAATLAGGGPFLSEDPLVPLAAGARPILLDAFMYRLAAGRDPAFGRPLEDAVSRGAFRAVVLLHDPAEDRDGWYERQLGARAIAAIAARYAIAGRAGPYVVLLPRTGPDPVAARGGTGDASGGGGAAPGGGDPAP